MHTRSYEKQRPGLSIPKPFIGQFTKVGPTNEETAHAIFDLLNEMTYGGPTQVSVDDILARAERRLGRRRKLGQRRWVPSALFEAPWVPKSPAVGSSAERGLQRPLMRHAPPGLGEKGAGVARTTTTTPSKRLVAYPVM